MISILISSLLVFAILGASKSWSVRGKGSLALVMGRGMGEETGFAGWFRCGRTIKMSQFKKFLFVSTAKSCVICQCMAAARQDIVQVKIAVVDGIWNHPAGLDEELTFPMIDLTWMME